MTATIPSEIAYKQCVDESHTGNGIRTLNSRTGV